MIILVDMDGVIADFEESIVNELKANYPSIPIIEKEKRDKLIKDFYKEEKEIIDKIKNSQNFIKNLKPIEGAIDALKELKEKGHEIFICSSPLSENKYSWQEKYEWILKHLGEDWKKRLILVKDKTLIKADILIDDKPEIKGIKEPSWKHILFEQPYNKNSDKKRINWKNYKEVLEI